MVLLDEVHSFVNKKLDTAIVTAETINSKLQRYVVITRRMKVLEVVGPHDSLRLVVGEDGQYKLSYDKNLDKGRMNSP